MEPILIGVTDRSITVFIPDPASTDGSGKTGLNAAALTVSYTRVETDNDVVVTDVTSSLSDLSALTDAHTDWGLKEVSSTLAPGLYRLDIADAVFASGAWYAIVYVMVTSSAAAAVPKAFQLVAYNPLDGVRMGMTALPNAAADAAGGLIISDAGGLDADDLKADVTAILADTNELQTDWANGGRLDLIVDAILDDTDLIDDGTSGLAKIATDVAAVLVDTNELQTDWVNGGRLDLIIDAILADSNELQTDWVNGGRLDLIVDAILADSNELQTDWVNGGRLDLILDIIAADTTTDIPALIAALNNLSAAQVNAEVVDVLNVDTFAEPTGVPAATASIVAKLGVLYMMLRNRVDVTATKKTFYDDGGSAEFEKDLSDDGTTYSESEVNSV